MERTEREVDRGAVGLAVVGIISAIISFTSAGVLISAKQEVKSLLTDYTEERRRKTLYKESSWKDANNVTHTVHTERLMIEGVWEDEKEWCKRHDSAVFIAQQQYPPV